MTLINSKKVKDSKHKLLTNTSKITNIIRTSKKTGNKSESLLNETRQIVYSLYQAKEITEKAYKNIMNSIKVLYKMDDIFMNSENSKTSEPLLLLLNFGDKINLKRSNKYVALSNHSIYYRWKNIKKVIQKQYIKNLNSNMEWILWYTWWMVFCIRYSRLFWTHIKKTWRKDW